VRRTRHRHGGLPDGENGDPVGDEDELSSSRGGDGTDAEGVAAPADRLANQSFRLDRGDGGAEKLGEEFAGVQRGRSVTEGRE
jgi:hypothetical protein